MTGPRANTPIDRYARIGRARGRGAIHLAKKNIDVLRRTPAYSFGEAAHYLGLPVSTLRAWCLGQGYAYKGQSRRFRPLIKLDGKPTEGLSFLNLVEAHVLAGIRRAHGVPLPKVRTAVAFVADELGVDRPLAHVRFQTDGINLFVEELGRLLNASQGGQMGMVDILQAYLRRVERDPAGVPIKLYPFTRNSSTAESPAPVEIDPRVSFGRPVLKGRGVPTAILADRFKAGDLIVDLAKDYDTSPQAIEEAIRCELDRRQAA